MNSLIGYAVAGAIGSLARDVVKDNSIVLPKFQEGKLLLGFIGGMIVGAFVGWAIDSSYLTAALSGYVGVSAINHLLPEVKER